MRKRIVILLLASGLLLACAASTQLQPVVLRSIGAVDGSFGVRPMSHQCVGLRVDGALLGWWPAADVRFSVGRFSIRYWVDEDLLPERPYCLGQDVWFGE